MLAQTDAPGQGVEFQLRQSPMLTRRDLLQLGEGQAHVVGNGRREVVPQASANLLVGDRGHRESLRVCLIILSLVWEKFNPPNPREFSPPARSPRPAIRARIGG